VSGYVARVREAALALRTDIDAARMPVAGVTLLERTRTALGRAAQFELASLKRAYKNEGMSEAEIHAIIPDRPPAKTKAQKDPQAPAPELPERLTQVRAPHPGSPASCTRTRRPRARSPWSATPWRSGPGNRRGQR